MVGSILLIQTYVYSIVKGYIVFVGKYVTSTKFFSTQQCIHICNYDQ